MDILIDAQRLREQGQAFCLVSVLRVQPPASAKPGDKALVTQAGIVAGWIGGGCAQPAVVKTVRRALLDGRSRVIRITPSESGPQEAASAASTPQGGWPAWGGPAPTEGTERELQDVLEFGMACHSGGTLELFVDPVLPQPQLIIVGDSPLAAALCTLAPRVGLPVSVLAHQAEAARFPDAVQVHSRDDDLVALPQGAFVVVATQGRRDLQGLRAALALNARQVFFVASARKAAVLKAALIEAGETQDAVQAIVAPAGQAIGAQTPEEIALSVLVAVVAARRGEVTAPAPLPVAAPLASPVKASCCGG